MNYSELKIECLLKKDIHKEEALLRLSEVINKCLLLSNELKIYHKLNTFKFYSYSSLYPVAKNDCYKKDGVYSFNLRALDPFVAQSIKTALLREKHDLFEVRKITYKQIDIEHVDKLFNLTPAVARINDGDNKYLIARAENAEEVISQVNKNAKAKYKMWFDEEIPSEHNFIEDIKVLNAVPIASQYKNGVRKLGNKFDLIIKKDEVSQKLAQLIYIVGVLESNALGYGFCSMPKRKVRKVC